MHRNVAENNLVTWSVDPSATDFNLVRFGSVYYGCWAKSFSNVDDMWKKLEDCTQSEVSSENGITQHMLPSLRLTHIKRRIKKHMHYVKNRCGVATCVCYEAKPGRQCKQQWPSGPQPRSRTPGSVPKPSSESGLASSRELLRSDGWLPEESTRKTRLDSTSERRKIWLKWWLKWTLDKEIVLFLSFVC